MDLRKVREFDVSDGKGSIVPPADVVDVYAGEATRRKAVSCADEHVSRKVGNDCRFECGTEKKCLYMA